MNPISAITRYISSLRVDDHNVDEDTTSSHQSGAGVLESNLDRLQVPHLRVPSTADIAPPHATHSTPPMSAPIDQLRTRAEAIINVFDDPRYAELDVPDWVHRNDLWSRGPDLLSTRKPIRAMFNSAAKLGLVDGERYVLSTICACAEDVYQATLASGLPQEKHDEALARALQRLASAWVAFLLWPLCAYNVEEESFPWQKVLDEMTGPERSLRDEVLQREGHKCSLTGFVDEIYWYSHQTFLAERGLARVEPTRIFRWPFAPRHSELADRDQQKSSIITLELARRYGQVDDKYLRDADLIYKSENALAICAEHGSLFNRLAFALIPTDTPNTYRVKSFEPEFTRFEHSGVPDVVTFQDHSSDGANNDGQQALPVSLPSPELLRPHAAFGNVLYESDTFWVFFQILRRRDQEGSIKPPQFDGAAFWKDVVDSDVDLDDLARRLQLFADNVPCSSGSNFS